MTKNRRLLLLFIPLITLLAACAVPTPAPTGAGTPEAIYTSAAQTMMAQLTLDAGKAAVAQLTLAAGETAVAKLTQLAAQPTSTSASPTPAFPTANFTVTAPPAPSATPAAQTRCDWAELVGHVTVPDNTAFFPGTVFTKVWRVRNIGSCDWTSRYALVFAGGSAMNSPAEVFLPASVRPGEMVDLPVTLTAPASPGIHRADWLLRNLSGGLFGLGPDALQPLSVQIQVIQVTPTPSSILGLRWNQQGGGDDICEDLSIIQYSRSDAVAQARSCVGSGRNLGSGSLTSDELDQLLTWQTQLATFDAELFNAEGNEPLTAYITFTGRGTGEAGNAHIIAISDFAERVFNRISR